jgi:branched-chain amino acid transport system substrate-binding protein
VPKSGQSAATELGAQTVKPVEAGIRELNAAGGLMGIPVELAIADDQCDAGHAINAADRQVGQEIHFVIGPVCPAAAMAAAPIYGKAGVVQFLPSVTVAMVGADMRPEPTNIFSMVATDEQEAASLGDYLAHQPKGKKLTFVYTDAFYRRALVSLVRAALPPDMKASARFEPVIDSSGVYDRLADQLQNDPPDIIYMAIDNAQIVELVGRLRKLGIKSLVMGGQRLLSYSFWRDAHAIEEGIQVIAPIRPPTTPELHTAVDLLRQAGVSPDLVALNSYALVQIWAESVRRAGGGDPGKVIKSLRSGEFQTAVGPVSFDELGNRRDTGYSVLTWRDGQPRRVDGPK